MRFLLPTLLLITACGGGGSGPQLGFSSVSGRLTVLSTAPQRELQPAVPWPSNIATAHVSDQQPQGRIGAGELAVFRYVADAPGTLTGRIVSGTVEAEVVFHNLETGAVSRSLRVESNDVYDVIVSATRGRGDYTVRIDPGDGAAVPAALPDGYVRFGHGHAAREIVAAPLPGVAVTELAEAVLADVVEGDERVALLRLRGAPHEDPLRELSRVLCCCARLEAAGLARYAEPNYLRRLANTPNDPRLGEQWGFDQTRVRAAWTITTGSTGVVVGVVDSGVRASHPDLAGRLLFGYDFVDNDPDPHDPTSNIAHGTSMASIIAAATNDGVGMAGINWNALIIPLRAFDTAGFGTAFRIAQAILFAAGLGNSSGQTAAQTAQVINLSFASGVPTMVEQGACDDARAAGILLVSATGNDGKVRVQYPAGYPSVMACTATNVDGGHELYSNTGTYVRITGPGGNNSLGVLVASFNNGSLTYATPNGTSFACPHVSGIAALVLSVADLGADELQQLLEDTAQDVGPVGYDTSNGFGIVDAYAAVLAALGQPEPTLIPGEVIEVRLVQVSTGKTVFRVETTEAQLSFNFPQVGTGEYFLIAGTDRDFDDEVDDFGEVTGQYSNGQTKIIRVLPNANLANLDFTIAPK